MSKGRQWEEFVIVASISDQNVSVARMARTKPKLVTWMEADRGIGSEEIRWARHVCLLHCLDNHIPGEVFVALLTNKSDGDGPPPSSLICTPGTATTCRSTLHLPAAPPCRSDGDMPNKIGWSLHILLRKEILSATHLFEELATLPWTEKWDRARKRKRKITSNFTIFVRSCCSSSGAYIQPRSVVLIIITCVY